MPIARYFYKEKENVHGILQVDQKSEAQEIIL